MGVLIKSCNDSVTCVRVRLGRGLRLGSAGLGWVGLHQGSVVVTCDLVVGWSSTGEGGLEAPAEARAAERQGSEHALGEEEEGEGVGEGVRGREGARERERGERGEGGRVGARGVVVRERVRR